MKKVLIFIVFIGLLIGNSSIEEISFNPFKNSKKVNYSLNDISNYPIGIFQFDRKYLDYEVSFNTEFDNIVINEKILSSNSLIPYISTFDNYISDLYSSNQKFNLLQPEFILLFKTSANSKLEKFFPLLSKTKTLL